MKTAKVRPDYTIEIPEEIRDKLQPGDSLDVEVSPNGVYFRWNRNEGNLRCFDRLVERIRQNPPDSVPTPEEIEEIIHEVRREKAR